MPEAIRGADLPHMASEMTKARRQVRAQGRKGQVESDLSGKTWDELTPPEKDAVLEALALTAGLVEPAP